MPEEGSSRYNYGVFFLFSSRLGCFGSIMVSALLTLLVVLLLWH